MIYELRIYHMHPGKIGDIQNRFANHTLGLFERDGIKVTDFWVDAEDANRIYYVCEFEDVAAKESAWARFRENPDWIKARTESELSGPIVERVESYTMSQAPFFKK